MYNYYSLIANTPAYSNVQERSLLYTQEILKIL